MTEQNRSANTADPIDETRLQLGPADDTAGPPLDDAPRSADEDDEDDEFEDEDEDEEAEDGDDAELGEEEAGE